MKFVENLKFLIIQFWKCINHFELCLIGTWTCHLSDLLLVIISLPTYTCSTSSSTNSIVLIFCITQLWLIPLLTILLFVLLINIDSLKSISSLSISTISQSFKSWLCNTLFSIEALVQVPKSAWNAPSAQLVSSCGG